MAKKKPKLSRGGRTEKSVPRPSASPELFFRSTRGLLLLCALLSALVIGTFWPSVHCLFQFYDENDYLVRNVHVNQGFIWEGACWAFTSLGKSNWVPLTWFTHMMDFQIYGFNPWGHHLTNILIHAANVSLLFLLLRKMTGAVGRSFIVAVLFAVHPLRVESVTWISERKDVVSFFFGMLAFFAYVRYAEESKKTDGRPERFYLLTLLLFILSLMSKATLVTFPCLLLLLDYWPLRRIQNFKLDRTKLELLAEKIPFLLLIVPISIAAKLAEKFGDSILIHPPLTMRLETALISYMRYLGYLFWPENLSSNYPYPKSWPTGELWLAAVILLGLSALAIMQYRRRPYLLIGWLWYLGTLVPVNGIIEQIGSPSMADRYTYIPMIGILLMVVWGINDLTETMHVRWRPLLVLAPVVALTVLLIVVTRHDIAFWKDGDIRWSRAAAVTRDNWTAYSNLGTTLDLTDSNRALDCFEKSVKINPDFEESQRELGHCLFEHKRYTEAIEHFRIASILNTDDPRSQAGWGAACLSAGFTKEAIFHLQMAHAIDPGNVSYMGPLADLLMNKHRFAEAIPVLKSLCAVQTNDSESFNMLGCALGQNGQLDGSIQAFQTALNLAPGSPQIETNLANTIAYKKEQQFQRSLTNGAALAHPHMTGSK
jgi:Flp pilus assembly protein TadD